jgi:hypothetical protein
MKHARPNLHVLNPFLFQLRLPDFEFRSADLGPDTFLGLKRYPAPFIAPIYKQKQSTA